MGIILMTGVVILALKKQTYAAAAFNLALSIKYHNPKLNITLLTDNIHLNCYRVEHFAVFDNVKEISAADYTSNGLVCPGKAKLSVHKYTPYDKTLYIDSDSICFGSLDLLFKELDGSEFKSNIINDYTTWADTETIKWFFDTEPKYTINSSWFYFENSKVLDLANQFYNKDFPKDKLIQKWGGSLPDELFLNAAVSILNIDPVINSTVMFFDDRKDQRSITKISEDHNFITFYGNKNNTRLLFQEWYDKEMFRICSHFGIEHRFKMHEIITHKHVNNK